MGTIELGATPNWRTEGVRVIPGDALDTNTAQTPGMTRAAAVTHDRTGSAKLWAGTVTIHPGAKTGAHHHGELESVIYVIRGRARMRWGANLEFTAEAGPGGFIFVPPFVRDQRLRRRAAGMRGDPQRTGADCGQPGHRRGVRARKCVLGRSGPPGGSLNTVKAAGWTPDPPGCAESTR